jgi:hypothetical protein
MTVHVGICIPSGDMVHAEFAMALAALVGMTQAPKVSIWNRRSSVLPESRNGLVRDAFAVGATHLLWLDSDMIVPPVALDRLLAHKAPIVGATYRRRSPPNDVIGRAHAHEQAEAPEGMTVMRYLGFGCMLIEADVFRALPQPWFNYDLASNPQIHEDRWFCERAREAGYRVLCDDWLTTQVGHIGTITHRIEPLAQPIAEAA